MEKAFLEPDQSSDDENAMVSTYLIFGSISVTFAAVLFVMAWIISTFVVWLSVLISFALGVACIIGGCFLLCLIPCVCGGACFVGSCATCVFGAVTIYDFVTGTGKAPSKRIGAWILINCYISDLDANERR